ncbi:MAG: CAP domain-containing protein, partial [Chloroflexota bacterium]|nr:CAP domain-containing protein [Chloroflexota bacterium]
MNRLTRAPAIRRLASLTIAAVLGLAILAPAAVAATTPEPVSAAAITAAEKQMVAALNADRTALGLVPVQVDVRLMAIAKERSVDMATKGYFSHTQPDGRNVFDIVRAAKITWFKVGEIIAWNNYPIDSTASAANRQWMNSPGHKAIVISKDFNYVGVGVALGPDGRKLWTAVYMKGPDRTGARATV